MKLKYQLRGLGIGMIVTAILMGVATGHGIPLTDAEIRARALELGMVEGGSLKLSDVGEMSTPVPQYDEDPGSEVQDPGDAEGNQDSGGEDIQDGDRDGLEPDSPDAEPAQPETEGSGEQGAGGRDAEDSGTDTAGEPGQEEGGSHVVRDGDTVAIIIEPGTDSYAISRTLAEAGLVADAGEFDRFLCENLYSRKIVDGTYEIPAGAGEEEIAKIITRDR